MPKTHDTNSLSQRLETIAEDIEPTIPKASDRLRSLSAAVDGGHYADIWATSDIYQLIDPDAIAESIRDHGAKDDWARIMELLRNSLVFAPIAVTWLGIWHALESYSTAILQDPDLSSFSFLFLWQLGFGGRSLTLSTIALIDGVLLSLVFILTLIVLWHNNQKEIDAQHTHDELIDALAEASLSLGHRRIQRMSDSAHVIEKMGQDLLTELRQERQRIRDMTSQQEQGLTNLTQFSQNLLNSSQSMIGAMQALQQIPQQLDKHFTGLAASLQHLSTQQSDQQKEFARAVHNAAQQLKELADVQQNFSSDLQTMGANLQAMGTNLSLLVQNLSSQQQEFVSTASHASTQFKQLTEAQKTIGINLQTMLINMQTMSVDLRTTVDTLQTTANETSRAADEIGSLLPALTNMQSQLLKLMREQKPDAGAGAGVQHNT